MTNPKLDFVRLAVARRIRDQRAALERAIMMQGKHCPELRLWAFYSVAFLRHG